MKLRFTRFSVEVLNDGSLRFYKFHLFGFFGEEVKKAEEQTRIKDMIKP